MNNPANAKPKFEAVTPRLPVTDVEKTLAFYVDQLGFKLGWKWGNPRSTSGTFSRWRTLSDGDAKLR